MPLVDLCWNRSPILPGSGWRENKVTRSRPLKNFFFFLVLHQPTWGCPGKMRSDRLFLCFPLFAVNEYLFAVQARSIQIRKNVKTIGAQVLEQVVRGAYSINVTGTNTQQEYIEEKLISSHQTVTCANIPPDYSYDFNFSESDAPPTAYLPEGFTFLPSQICPERHSSMSKLCATFNA